MKITLLGVLTGMALTLLFLYAVQRIQESNQAKAETDEQSKVTNNTNIYRNRLG
jgi:hypothetical protein